jgi:hypothetical protein
MSPYTKDFVGILVPVRKLRIRGIGGSVKGIMMGTVKWQIEDDNGMTHTITIPGSYYVPDAPSRLLSPQHWAQQAKDHYPKPRGTWCVTYDNEITLQWNQRKYTRTIPLDPNETNTGTIYTAPGLTVIMHFAQRFNMTVMNTNQTLHTMHTW